MKQEDKELLLQDLCARIPYGVKCCANEICHILKGISYYNGKYYANVGYDACHCPIEFSILHIKPYLRSMINMTEEEMKTYERLYHYRPIELIHFVNSNHLDYLGLISKGLALEAPKDMYKFEWLWKH